MSKSKTLTVRFTPDEHKKVADEASKRDLSISDFVRMLIDIEVHKQTKGEN